MFRSFGHLYIFFQEMSIQISPGFFSWDVYLSIVELYEFFSLIHILRIKPLLDLRFSIIFSIVWVVFLLSWYDVQKPFFYFNEIKFI